jgi:effector-binding domain-containing protein
LYYDGEFRDEDADFEPCMPVRKLVRADGIDVRELPGGRCVALVHRGAYNELGRSYERLIKYVKEQGYAMQLPTREVYLKGPGMIFKGNPKKYLTEIQILIGDGGNDA